MSVKRDSTMTDRESFDAAFPSHYQWSESNRDKAYFGWKLAMENHLATRNAVVSDDVGFDTDAMAENLQKARARYAASRKVAVPDGYVLVPLEPTEAMIMAGSNAAHDVSDKVRWFPPAWRAALRASQDEVK